LGKALTTACDTRSAGLRASSTNAFAVCVTSSSSKNKPPTSVVKRVRTAAAAAEAVVSSVLARDSRLARRSFTENDDVPPTLDADAVSAGGGLGGSEVIFGEETYPRLLVNWRSELLTGTSANATTSLCSLASEGAPKKRV
jgi:hypothetical protein